MDYFKLKIAFLTSFIFFFTFSYAQIGIGRDNPRGILDVNQSNNKNTAGLVVPRTGDVTTIKTPEGDEPIEGTLVYDIKEECLRVKMETEWSQCLLDSVGLKTSVNQILGVGDNFKIKKVSAGYDNSLVIGIDGWLYTAGNNTNAKTGLGRSSGNTVSFTLILGQPTVYASAGYLHGVAVNQSGDLYTWGNNAGARTGQQAVTSGNTVVPTLVEEFGANTTYGRVIAAEAALTNSYALTESGKVYSVGTSTNGSSGTGGNLTTWTLLNIPETVQAISASYYTAGALSSTGNVYVWGTGANGRLGIGTANLTTPTQITFPQPIKQLSMGAACGIALATDNVTVYAWGRSGSATNTADWTSPQVITIPGFDPATDQVLSVAARRFDNGTGSIAIVTTIGVFVTGTNSYGMLGVNTTTTLTALQKISGLRVYRSTEFLEASIGYRHTLLTTGENQYNTEYNYVGYGMGYTTNGRLGAMSGNQRIPTIITK